MGRGVWIWALLVCAVCAHTIDLMPNSEHCFFEDMHVGDEMTLTYQVSGGGHLDINTRVKDPEDHLLFQQLRKDTGSYDFVAEMDGRYTYCFSNEFSTVTDKTLRYVRWLTQLQRARHPVPDAGRGPDSCRARVA